MNNNGAMNTYTLVSSSPNYQESVYSHYNGVYNNSYKNYDSRNCHTYSYGTSSEDSCSVNSGFSYSDDLSDNKLINISNYIIHKSEREYRLCASLKFGSFGETDPLYSANSKFIYTVRCSCCGKRFQTTPLHITVHTGSLSMMKLLLDNGAPTDVKDPYGNTPLSIALKACNYPAFAELLKSWANINVVKYRGNKTILHLASTQNKVKFVHLLIQEGANVNAKDDNGLTSLHIAAQNGYIQIVKLLLSNNCDIEAKDNRDRKPLELAIYNRHFLVVELLLKRGASTEKISLCLRHMAKKGYYDMIQLIINHGVNINMGYNNRQTLLHYRINN